MASLHQRPNAIFNKNRIGYLKIGPVTSHIEIYISTTQPKRGGQMGLLKKKLNFKILLHRLYRPLRAEERFEQTIENVLHS